MFVRTAIENGEGSLDKESTSHEGLLDSFRNVLDILAERVYNDTKTDVFENNIVSQSGVPKSMVQIYLNELESRCLAEEVRPRPSGVDFRLWRIKKQGVRSVRGSRPEIVYI